MNGNLRTFLHNLGVVIVRNPVEIIISLSASLLAVLLYEKVLPEHSFSHNLALAPVIFAIPYIVNRLNCSKITVNIIYALSAFSAVIFFCENSGRWFNTGIYPAMLVITLAAISAYRNTKDNTLYFKEFLKFLKDLIFALTTATVAFLLLMAISSSVIYLFDIFKDHSNAINFYSAIFCYFIAAPAFFIYLDHVWDSARGEAKVLDISGISDIVVNYILSPALIIYTVILYLYIAVVTFTWSLPKGNLALMVFAFVMTAYLVKGILPLLGRVFFKGFYQSLSYISLIPLILFWIGAIYRINQYGFTEGRVYLLACGAIMTFTVISFLSARWGSFLKIAYAIVIVGLIFTFTPWISARDIGIRSQQNRLESLVSKLGITGVKAKINIPENLMGKLNTLKLEQACDILDYLKKYCDKEALMSKYGFSDGKELRKAAGVQLSD